jgi:transposase
LKIERRAAASGDALAACAHLSPVYRRLLNMELKQLQFLEQQRHELEQEIAQLLRPHAGAVERLAEVPGLGVESAHQIIAEIGLCADCSIKPHTPPSR